MQNILKPCPFCGGAAQVKSDFFEDWYVICKTCGETSNSCASKAIATWRWNARPIEDTLSARLAKLTTKKGANL